MTFRSIAILAACLVAVIVLADATVGSRLDVRAAFWYLSIVRTALLALVAVFAAVTASRFKWWQEYVGRAWTLFFIAYSLLALSEVARRFFPESRNVREGLVALGNLAVIGAYWLIARSLHAAGLGYYGSTASKIVFFVVIAALVIALCSGSLLNELRWARGGDPHPGSLLSVLADMITFVLVAPLLLTSFALRGGQQFWVFALLTAGTFGWMVNQAAGTVLRSAGLFAVVPTGRMLGFALACCFIAAAAFTQWLAARRGTSGIGSTSGAIRSTSGAILSD